MNLFKNSLFKNGRGQVASGADHLQRSFADFSECATDISVNFNKLTEAQTLLNRSEVEYEKQSRMFAVYPALRDSHARSRQLAHGELQIRKKMNDNIIQSLEERIITLANALHESGHTDSRKFKDMENTVHKVDIDQIELDRDIRRLDSESRKSMENQSITSRKVSGMETEHDRFRQNLVQTSKLMTSLDTQNATLEQELQKRSSMQSTIDALKVRQELLEQERDTTQSEVKVLKANQSKVLEQLQAIQDRLDQKELLESQRAKASANSSELAEKADMMWSVVIGDPDKDTPGILDEMKSVAEKVKSELKAEMSVDRQLFDQKLQDAQIKIKDEVHGVLNPLESRLGQLENQSTVQVSGQTIAGDGGMQTKIMERALRMDMDRLQSRVDFAQQDQSKHMAEFSIRLEQLESQNQLSAPPSKASSPTPNLHQSLEIMQRIEQIQDMLNLHRNKIDELATDAVDVKKNIKWIQGDQSQDSDHIKLMTGEIKHLAKVAFGPLFGPQFTLAQPSGAEESLNERVIALTNNTTLMKKDLEDSFKVRFDEHETTFHEFRRIVNEHFNKSQHVASEIIVGNPLAALTEVPPGEAAKLKTKNVVPYRNPNPESWRANASPLSPGSHSPGAIHQNAVISPRNVSPVSSNMSPVTQSTNARKPSRPSNLGPASVKTAKGAKLLSKVPPSMVLPSNTGSRAPNGASPTQDPLPAPGGKSELKRPPPSGSDSDDAPLAKKRSDAAKSTSRGRDKPRESDPAAYEDPNDHDYSAGSGVKGNVSVQPQRRQSSGRTPQKSSARPEIWDVPDD